MKISPSKQIFFPFRGIVAATLLATTSLYSAEIVARHDGATDPLEEGWTLVDETREGHYVSPIEDAWKILAASKDPTPNGSLVYSFNTEAHKDTANDGWILKATLSLEHTNNQYAVTIAVTDNSARRYIFNLNSLPSGNTEVIAPVKPINAASVRVDTGTSGYIDYKIVCDGISASLYINGSSTPIIKDYQGFDAFFTWQNTVRVGVNSSTSKADIHWKSLEYSVGTE